jgi:hypothetical protein
VRKLPQMGGAQGPAPRQRHGCPMIALKLALALLAIWLATLHDDDGRGP